MNDNKQKIEILAAALRTIVAVANNREISAGDVRFIALNSAVTALDLTRDVSKQK